MPSTNNNQTKTFQVTLPPHGQDITLIVEAAHIYTNEQPGEEHQTGAQVGGSISRYLQLFGTTVQQWLFVDNYNPLFSEKPRHLDEKKYRESLQQWGFAPDQTVYEADLVGRAADVLQYLLKHDFAAKYKDGRVALRKGKTLLYNSDTDKYMCALLDASLYLLKLEHAQGCITVLPQSYRQQQKEAMAIARRAGADTSRIFPYYFRTEEILSGSIPSTTPRAGTDTTTGERLAFLHPALHLFRSITALAAQVVSFGSPAPLNGSGIVPPRKAEDDLERRCI